MQIKLLERVLEVLEPKPHLTTWALEQDRIELANEIREYLREELLRNDSTEPSRKYGIIRKMVEWAKQSLRLQNTK